MENINNGTAPEQQQEKTFTQEEVNAIVQQRLAREKEKPDTALASREQELNTRELAITAKEMLIDRGMPVELSNIIKASDEKELNAAIELLNKYIKKDEAPTGKGFQIIGQQSAPNNENSVNRYRQVMGLK